MNEKVTSFGVETAFSSLKVGDSVIAVDNKGYPLRGKVTSKNEDGHATIIGGDEMICVGIENRVWVVEELRIKVVDIEVPPSETFHVYDPDYARNDALTHYHNNVGNGLLYPSVSSIFRFKEEWYPCAEFIINLLIENKKSRLSLDGLPIRGRDSGPFVNFEN